MTQARADKIEPAERFALLQEALRLAMEAGNTTAALNAARVSIESFDQPANFRLQVATRLLESAPGITEHVELATTTLDWAETGRVMERFDEAGQLSRLAGRAALKGRSTPLQRGATQSPWTRATLPKDGPVFAEDERRGLPRG